MNYIKAGLRVKLGLTNPYQIRPQFRLFQNSSNNEVPVTLLARHRINYDSYIISFKLPQENKCLGLKVGQYLWVEADGDNRPYVPVSPIDQPGSVDFLVRDMRTLNKNSFTEKLLAMDMNHPAKLSGPGFKFTYNGFGNFEYFPDDSPQQTSKHCFKHIGIITHASGITTTFNFIQSIAMNYESNLGVSLLWLGDKEEDFVLIDELGEMASRSKINLNLMLTKFEKGWLGPFGKVTKNHVVDFMPPPTQLDDTLIIMSALEGQLDEIRTHVADLGYKYTLYA